MKKLHAFNYDETREADRVYDGHGNPVSFGERRGRRLKLSVDILWTSDEKELSKAIADFSQAANRIAKIVNQSVGNEDSQ